MFSSLITAPIRPYPPPPPKKVSAQPNTPLLTNLKQSVHSSPWGYSHKRNGAPPMIVGLLTHQIKGLLMTICSQKRSSFGDRSEKMAVDWYAIAQNPCNYNILKKIYFCCDLQLSFSIFDDLFCRKILTEAEKI